MKEANTPCADQTADAVERWLTENVREGVEVVIREAQSGMLRYRRAKVTRLGKGRFDVTPVGGNAESFYYSGKNCWHPKGQTRLVIPTPAVLAACDDSAKNGGYMSGPPWSYLTAF